ncbi:PQQ-binding-like beta-propeller repeat protein [Marinibaculum pumilum]|uniref:PQQ-binding-like beta-propeller repeat protein n=1 Tax=Marinibaculum pumilum TaxID=1766165 RepID=A0ABV7KYX4_9PROT
MSTSILRRIAVVTGAVAMLASTAACDLTDLYGVEEDKPLPGERIPVMQLDSTLQADPRLEELDVRLPAPWANADWPQVGGYPSHAMHHLALGEQIAEAWRIDIGAGASDGQRIFAPPVVADGRLYAIDAESNLSAFDTQTGDRLWRVALAPEEEDEGAIGGGIAYWNGWLYATTAYGLVYKLSPADGSQVWVNDLGLPMRPAPTVFGGRVYVVTGDNTLHALSVADGTEEWSHTGIAEGAALVNAAAPAATESVVVVPFSSGEIFALRAGNGVVAWGDTLIRTGRISPVGEINDITGEPVMDRGVVFAVSHAGRMVAIDQRTGARLWETTFGGLNMPWVAGDFIFLVTLDSEVVALTRSDGRVRWVQQLERYINPDRKQNRGVVVWYGPVLAGDRLILLSSVGQAVTLSPYSGELLGELELPDRAMVPPIVAEETLYITTADGEIFAYR